VRISVTESFRRAYRELPAPVRESVNAQLRILARDPRDPSLAVKKVKGVPGIWEARIDAGHCMTSSVQDGVFFLRWVGPTNA
jgi:mRNA-degrading endonuclease RelE of RelBE toxin-antitoxin system